MIITRHTHSILRSCRYAGSSQVASVRSRVACTTAPWRAPTIAPHSPARCLSTTAAVEGEDLQVAVVGSGPSGFYSVKYLLKEHSTATVHLIDKLPVPYGLVRFGVAPDHPDVKSVMNDFSAVAADHSDRMEFLGNVEVGKDVSVESLLQHYDAVIMAYGAQGDTMLGVPGEQLRNVHSARDFVGWYNGHPDFKHLNPDLSGEHAVVVGNGNVAIDCARILAKSVEELSATDLPESVLAALAESKVKRVSILGRRGHVQSSFTMKELRELTRLDNASLHVDNAEIEAGNTEASQDEIKQHRVKKRLDQLLRKSATDDAIAKLDEDLAANPDKRQVVLRFLVSPTELLPHASETDRVGSVACGKNKLDGEANRQRAVATSESCSIEADLVLQSIGYKALPLEGVPFDDDSHTVNNFGGRVYDDEGEPVPGLYCAGWAKRGPSGIIGTNIPDARETVAAVLADERDGSMRKAPSADADLAATLRSEGVEVVSWADYMRLEAVERSNGESRGKPFEKFTTVEDMLAALKK